MTVEYDAVLDTVAGLISCYNKERNLRIVAEENLRMMTENAKSLRSYIDSRTIPRQGIEPQYDQSDVDAFYLSEENRALRATIAQLKQSVRVLGDQVNKDGITIAHLRETALGGKL